jgi:hypothetical protein
MMPPEKELLKFRFKEVMLGCLALYLHCYAAQLLFCVASCNLALVTLWILFRLVFC